MTSSPRPHPLIELVLVRLRDFYREPATVFWVFGFPLLLALALGLAFRNLPPDPVRVLVVDAGAREWIAPLLAPPAFTLLVRGADDAALALRRGQADVLVEATGPAQWRVRWDETRPESRLARVLVERALERGRGRTDVLAVQEENVVEPGSRYIDFLLPGLIGMNLMGSSMWGVGWAVVDARKKKLLKRLAATPMRRRDYLGSLLIARLIFLFAEVVALVAIGRFAFGVMVHGSHVAVLLLALLGGFSFTGIALLIAARAATTEVASGLLNAVQMPMWLLSGAFFSAARFPDWLQPLVQALPLTALNDALRAVVNEGATLSSQLGEMGILAAWGVLPFAIALRVFRWQ
jgi:ABC-2 type transport system permease protein